jgi:hypothetical protein
MVVTFALQSQLLAFLAACSLFAAAARGSSGGWAVAMVLTLVGVSTVRRARAGSDVDARRRGERYGAAASWALVALRAAASRWTTPARLSLDALALSALVPTAIMLASASEDGPRFLRRVRVRARRR